MAMVDSKTLSAVKEAVHLKGNELRTMDGIPDHLQQQIRRSMIGEEMDRNRDSEMESLLSCGAAVTDWKSMDILWIGLCAQILYQNSNRSG